MLELKLFDIPELRWEGKLLSLPSPKNLAILSYLALSGRSISRKDLSELFWKNGKPSNVRFVLHKLREIPGSEDWLETSETFVAVKAVTDVQRFENAVHDERYGKALEIYCGGEVLLKGLELTDAEEFMNYLDLERSRLGQLYLGALQGRIKELEKLNKTDEALKLARQLLEQDKLNENAHRAIMRLEHKRGNTEAALAQFETLRQILKEELDVEPLEDTLKLLRDIEGIGASSVKNALLLTSATAIPAKPDKLFGRDKLLVDIEKHLATSKRVLLHGFGGAGKTALATLVATRWLEQNKKSVLWLQAGDDKADTLFDAIARAFDARQSLNQSKDTIKTIRDLLIKHKISLFVLDDVWNAYALSKIMEALPESISLLVTSRQRYPNLTKVDVGRLGREAGLELLNHYAQSLPPLPGEVLESQSSLVHTDDGALAIDARLSDGGVLHSQDGHIANEEPPVLHLQRTQSTSSVDAPSPLRGGTEVGANQLCELLGDHAFALRIAGITLAVDGLAPEQLLGRIADAPHTLKTPLEFSETGRESVAALLGASLTALDEEAYEAFMGFGVLFTTSCTAELLALCTRRSEEETEEALITLQRRGLADRLSEAGSDVITYRLHDLAYSFAKANNHFRLRTAQRACQIFLEKHKQDFNVLDAEITNLLGASEAAKGGNDDELFVEMMRGLVVGNAYYEARGHSLRSFELLKTSTEVAKQLNDLEAAHYLLSKVGNAHRELYGDLDKALEAFGEALGLARALKNAEREAILLGVIGIVRFNKGEKEAKSYLDAAHHIAEAHQLDEVLCQILLHKGYIACYYKKWNATQKLSRESIQIAQILKDNPVANQFEVITHLFFSLLNLGEAEKMLGNFVEALKVRQEALQLAQMQRNLRWIAYAHEGIGEIHHELGNRSVAQENFQQALELFYQNNAFTDMETRVELMKKEGYAVNPRQVDLVAT
jgi:DNA-binding SARP family transcriptional activator